MIITAVVVLLVVIVLGLVIILLRVVYAVIGANAATASC